MGFGFFAVEAVGDIGPGCWVESLQGEESGGCERDAFICWAAYAFSNVSCKVWYLVSYPNSTSGLGISGLAFRNAIMVCAYAVDIDSSREAV